MAKTTRNIIKIAEEKCNGCGQCVPACKEGALQIVDGKARLVSEMYCDGLGACLGECPQGAITIEKREANEFSEEAVKEHLKNRDTNNEIRDTKLPCGCPGTMAKTIGGGLKSSPHSSEDVGSELKNWPVQLKLIPPTAPYLNGADIVFLADCTAVACANLHRDFIRNRVVIMACPKLDDRELYIDKLAEMFCSNSIRSIEVVMMEVPCCAGLSDIVNEALEKSGANIRKFDTIISLEGERLNSERSEL